MLPIDVIRKYYPDLSDEDLRKIQVLVYELCCGLMQHFYGEDWDKDSEGLDLENEEGWYSNLITSSNPNGVLGYVLNFEEFPKIF